MSKTLRGLHFHTESGAAYYYDDCSGMVFPCPAGLKRILAGMERGGGDQPEASVPEQENYWSRFIRERQAVYDAFGGMAYSCSHALPEPNPDYLAETIKRSGFRQLILTVTGACNMACRYCINSGAYPYEDKLYPGYMPVDVAKKAVNYYLAHIKQIRRHDPCRTAVITFYGGEPLLNFPLIKKIVKYAREKDENILFTISTNGLLLEDEAAEFLVKNEVVVWVSLDGPMEQHDRNRVTSSGKGTFNRVISNIEKLWERYPDYYLLGFLVTYDWAADLRDVAKFFRSHRKFKEALFMFSPVAGHFTDYYKRFSDTERNRYFSQLNELKQELYRREERDNDPFENFFLTAPYRLLLMRRLLGPTGSREFPATAPCLPGEKICVLPDGRLQPCERVPGLADIGTVEAGLDFYAIAALIARYNESITSYCTNCSIQRLCRTCFSHFWSGDGFRKPVPDFCTRQLAATVEVLKETYGLLERRPEFYREIMGIYQRRYSKFLSLQF